jgi:hypothetical protein
MLRHLIAALCLGALLLLAAGCGKKPASNEAAPPITPAARSNDGTVTIPPPPNTDTNVVIPPPANAAPTNTGTDFGVGTIGTQAMTPMSPDEARKDPGMTNVPEGVPLGPDGLPITRLKRLEQKRKEGASMDQLNPDE